MVSPSGRRQQRQRAHPQCGVPSGTGGLHWLQLCSPAILRRGTRMGPRHPPGRGRCPPSKAAERCSPESPSTPSKGHPQRRSPRPQKTNTTGTVAPATPPRAATRRPSISRGGFVVGKEAGLWFAWLGFAARPSRGHCSSTRLPAIHSRSGYAAGHEPARGFAVFRWGKCKKGHG